MDRGHGDVATRDAPDAFIEELIPSDDTPVVAEAQTVAAMRRVLARQPALAQLGGARTSRP